MRSRWIAAWRVGALLAVAAIAAVNVVSTAQRVLPPPIDGPATSNDPIVRHEKRFAALRVSVEARGLQGRVGYFGDPLNAGDDYFYAQFVLVPLVLDINPESCEWAVANWPASSEERLPAGWRVAENFAEGVLLLRKSAP